MSNNVYKLNFLKVESERKIGEVLNESRKSKLIKYLSEKGKGKK